MNLPATLKQPKGVFVGTDDIEIAFEPLRPAAPPLLFSLDGIDLNATVVDLDGIQAINKHRGEAQQIDRIAWIGEGFAQAVAVRYIRDDEWWCPGHIPGHPIMPAVMMVEAAAQLTSWLFQARKVVDYEFVGFTRIDNTKFRNKVTPGDTLYILANQVKFHLRRFICDAQGIVNGKVAFESRITGMPII